MNEPILMWFRQDLRLGDNPALHHAVESGRPVSALFVLDEVSENIRPMGSAQKWWLHHSLNSLAKSLRVHNVELILRRGPALDVVPEVMKETGASQIVWNRRYGIGEQSIDKQLKASFGKSCRSFDGLLMHEPSLVRTGGDAPYKVYTPFWKKFSASNLPRLPCPDLSKIHANQTQVTSENLDDWKLLPHSPDWSLGISENWQPGETGAHAALAQFLKDGIETYDKGRDLPGPDNTSRLSPYLRFGEISPHQLWAASLKGENQKNQHSREIWRKELVWREFSYHLLQEWPDLATENFNKKFDSFPWVPNDTLFDAWKMGHTGYPIVDAGMRQLWHTGWMHNRVRMIVASFLVKHLLQDWRRGEQWFWDTLVDGDPAANPAQWQWVAGSGADAAPYFRIFNPILQAGKFDPKGEYIHRWVPELKSLPAKHLSAPWETPPSVLQEAGVKLGETYPLPIVDHQTARAAALDALNSMNNPH